VLHISICGAWSFVWGTKPTKARPVATGLLHIVTFVYTVGIYSGKKFALYIFDSDNADTSLNRHYLTK